jgi:hypothetical protein
MFDRLLKILTIRCNHKNTSKPFTAARAVAVGSDWEPVGNGPSHYVVCLDCGKKLSYDWNLMRIVRT